MEFDLTWGETKELPDGRTVRSATPTPEFWEVWRSHKDEVKALGYGVSKYQGEWQVSQWTTPDAAEVEATVSASRATDATIAIPSPDGLEYLPFQRAGIAYALGRESTLLADEMGLGKTIQAIGVCNATKPETVLIVCPASLKLNWRNELQRWLVDERRIDIVNGGGEVFPAHPDIVVINYDVLTKHADALHGRTWDIVILDEAHFCKNPKAKRTKAALAISAERKLVLTGTPIPNRPVEIQAVAGYLAPSRFGHFFKFAMRYCDAHQTRHGWDFLGASNLPELQEQLRSSIMVRRLKADVLDELPPKRRQVIVLDGADYKEELRVQELAEAESQTTSPRIKFEELSRERHLMALAKVPAILDHLKGIDHPVVIFAHHKDVIAALASELDCVTLTGDHTTEERQAAVESFQRGDVQYFIGSLGAAGVGITLTRASHVLFAELDWVPGNLSQAEDRCHRIGQHDSVLVQHLVVDESIDARQVELVVEKQGVLDASLDTVAAPKATEAPAPTTTLRDLLDATPAPQSAITVPGLTAAFERAGATVNRPRLAIGALRITTAPEHGNNAGCLYVKRDGEYQGKVTADSVFRPVGSADTQTGTDLLAIDEDPIGGARRHGRETGVCSNCGRELTHPESLRIGMGPKCGAAWWGMGEDA
jgi:SWI/SNF-related matrix-associated actin-dependent regulator 1 of chromatin subfamily A